MRHSKQPQRPVEPRAWRRIFPDDAIDEVEEGGTAEQEDDLTDVEDRDPDETPPMPRPAVRLENR
ncbi:MAG TPA: hypothetical protein VLF95_10575 [Vicinamibacteria bacterium]|nr:hypothetical protein [Vicinamibacteria bacterium]